MTSISKRTQARNEKALQDLIKTVPGNDRCADCGARNPGTRAIMLTIYEEHPANTNHRLGQLECEYPTHIALRERRLVDVVKLGIFLCMRCASLHRKLGTHISKVKSLSMDSWSNEQVDVRVSCTERTRPAFDIS